MSELIATQWHLFLVSLLCGIGIGIFYDLIRIIRRIIAHSNWMISLEDVIFWLSSSVILFIILFMQNNGVIRGYVILGVVVGMLFYFSIISHFFVTKVSSAIKGLIKYLLKMIQAILKPVRVVVRWIIKPIKWVYRLTRKQARWRGKQLKKWAKTVKILTKKI